MKTNYEFKSKFAEGLSFPKLFYMFLIASFFGAIYESAYGYIRMFLIGEVPRWIIHRGVIYGSLNIIYGVGAVLMCLILVGKNRPRWKTFLYATILGGATEYLISLCQETFLGTISWNYSDKFLNIAGRTTIPYMFFWGLLGIVFVEVVYPFVSRIIEKIPVALGTRITKILVVLLVLDCAISWTAIIRQQLRRRNIPPKTKIGRICDKYYTDEVLHKYFDNMVEVNK
jgi:uncharacterized membrane protein